MFRVKWQVCTNRMLIWMSLAKQFPESKGITFISLSIYKRFSLWFHVIPNHEKRYCSTNLGSEKLNVDLKSVTHLKSSWINLKLISPPCPTTIFCMYFSDISKTPKVMHRKYGRKLTGLVYRDLTWSSLMITVCFLTQKPFNQLPLLAIPFHFHLAGNYMVAWLKYF